MPSPAFSLLPATVMDPTLGYYRAGLFFPHRRTAVTRTHARMPFGTADGRVLGAAPPFAFTAFWFADLDAVNVVVAAYTLHLVALAPRVATPLVRVCCRAPPCLVPKRLYPR